MSITKNNTKVNNQFAQLSKNVIANNQLTNIKGGTVKTLADWIDDEY